MKYIITEEQLSGVKRWKKFEIFMKRRDEIIKEFISQHTHPFKDKMDKMDRFDEDVVTIAVINMVISNIISSENISYEDTEYDWVRLYLKDNYTDYIKKELGVSGRQEQMESELTERCWKGYTQKGMKTMFGKKYPNCVKK